MIWIIENHEELNYDTDILNSDWLAGGPWYNTSICNKLNIINARTDRYNIMYYIDAYEREHQSSSCEDGIIGGSCPLTINSMKKSL